MSRTALPLVICLLALTAGRAAADVPAAATAAEPLFLRFVEDDDGHARLEAAVVSYRRDNVVVDLVSAVHVAERSFYEGLNRDFATRYDVVLYEMVKPHGMRPLPPAEMARASRSGLSVLHRIMQRATQLAFQMDVVDYTPDHFIHADLDWDSFAEAFQRQNELSGILLRSYAAAAAGEQTTAVHPEVLVGQFLLAASDPAQAHNLKYMLAQEFAHLDRMTQALAGPDGGVLVGRRNQAAIDALRNVLRTRPNARRIALFYGAAHMKDLGQRLADLGFEPGETRWLTAWDIPGPAETAVEAPATAPATRPAG